MIHNCSTCRYGRRHAYSAEWRVCMHPSLSGYRGLLKLEVLADMSCPRWEAVDSED